LQAERALGGEQAAEVGLKGIEQRKGFQRVNVAEIAAKADGVLAQFPSGIIRKFSAALLIKIRVAAVYAGREGIQDFQMRLGCVRGEVKCAVRILAANFIDKAGTEDRA